jgi:hypothetical protein
LIERKVNFVAELNEKRRITQWNDFWLHRGIFE